MHNRFVDENQYRISSCGLPASKETKHLLHDRRTYTPEVLNREIFDSAATFHTKSWGMNSFKRLRAAGTEPEGDMSRPRQHELPFKAPAPAKSPSSFRPETVVLWIAHPSPKP